jgi:hypothetical protein
MLSVAMINASISPEPAASDDPLGALRAQLQRLHLVRGKPSARAIHRKTSHGISHTTVAKVLRCTVCPTWGQLELIVEALDGDVEAFRALWIAVHE